MSTLCYLHHLAPVETPQLLQHGDELVEDPDRHLPAKDVDRYGGKGDLDKQANVEELV